MAWFSCVMRSSSYCLVCRFTLHNPSKNKGKVSGVVEVVAGVPEACSGVGMEARRWRWRSAMSSSDLSEKEKGRRAAETMRQHNSSNESERVKIKDQRERGITRASVRAIDRLNQMRKGPDSSQSIVPSCNVVIPVVETARRLHDLRHLLKQLSVLSINLALALLFQLHPRSHTILINIKTSKRTNERANTPQKRERSGEARCTPESS
jgi:hypothetical protein